MTSPSPQTPLSGRQSGAVRGALLGALAIYLAISVWVACRGVVLQPFSDMFDWIARYYLLGEGLDPWSYLFAPHNFHRLLWTFAILALDIRVFGASGYLFVATSAACLVVTAALLAREASRAARPPLRLAAGAVGAMLVLMSVNLMAAGLYIHASYLQVLVFAVLAIVLSEPAAGGRASAWRRLAVLASVAAATFGNAVGLALWPVLLFSAWRSGADRRWLLTLAVSGAVFSGLYVAGQTADAATAATSGGLWSKIVLLVKFLGLPWTQALPAFGWVIGGLFLAASTGAVVFKGGPRASRAERIAVQLILFSLAVAVMAAVGRSALATPEQPSVRYATLLTPLHVGLLILSLPYAARLRARHPRTSDLALVVLAVAFIVHQGASGLLVIKATDVDRGLIAAFRAGDRSPAMAVTIHPRLYRAVAISARLRHDGFYQRELYLPPARHRPAPPPSGG